METSVLIAQIAAVTYLAVALGGFISKDYYRRLIDDFYGNAGLIYLGGFMALVVGFLIVHVHNHWTSDWTVLVTILGWLALIKGITLMVLPASMLRISASFLNQTGMKLFPWAALLPGLIFTWFGFIN
ncbi:MAG: hypothetical protein Q9M30_01145 [Mariprofundaceae bacterium]|nr:hypothetical protein [Mariprofundaceae bacterium]